MTTGDARTEPPATGAPPTSEAAAAPVPAPTERPPVRENRRQLLSVLFAAAWLTCVLVEPMPDGPEPDDGIWTTIGALGTVVSIVVAIVLLWRGHRLARPAGITAGLFMCLATAMCPLSGHHLVGAFLWVQTAMSLFVLIASARLPRRDRP